MAGTTIKAMRDQLFQASKRSTTAETTVEHNKAVTDLDALNTLVTQLRTHSLYSALGNPGFQISSNFDIQNANAFSYTNGGTLKSVAATQVWDTGTTATVPATKWAAFLLSLDSAGSRVCTAFTNSSAGYNSEALAIAALTAAAATNTVVGYVTLQAGAATWTAGTSALAGGTGGTPATTTNYYNSVNPNNLYVGSAVTITAAKIADNEGTVLT